MNWEEKFELKLAEVSKGGDPAHDFQHFKRVVNSAKKLCLMENAKMEVVVPAAWLHDLVNVPKDDPLRSQASRLSAMEALKYLKNVEYPLEFLPEISHAIEAHSFSANLKPRTLEAMIVQDADRLDGLGAIGIARCFAIAGQLKRPFYAPFDPFCIDRPADDSLYTIDHFYQKLFKTAEAMNTKSGKAEARRRVDVMSQFLDDLNLEIAVDASL